MVLEIILKQKMMTLKNIDTRPRQQVFSKLERLISLMNDQKTGIPLREKKNFLTTVYNSFTGNEFIAWLTENICANDSLEALHVATFLLMYGYVYPIDVKNFVVKDDKSAFYKFQSPYYWPSKNLKLSNEKYIIYLIKRSKRNKQKHGLEEYEQNALSKLQIVFSDKMGFMSRQADEQVNQVKAMRRDDKMVHDLQERAFWRVFRPPPGQVKFLEEGPSRCFQPSQMLQRKRKNRELVVKEVNYLRKAMTRPRMKFSKSLDIFIKNCEQYMKYDPLHNEKAAQPSNPWISEDEVMWDINRRIVEIPTEMRIRMWALRFEALLQDATGCLEFEHFLKKEYSLENIRFYKACKELIVCPNSDVARWKAEIEREFLTPGAPCEVNIDCKTLEQVLKQLHSDNDVSCKSRFIFQPAMEHVYGLMKKDSYTRFIRSDQYKQLLEKSQTVFAKKRFFNFGSNRKKTTAPSPQVRRRGSVSSDGGIEAEIGGASYHSYSTGNLKELEDKPKHALRQTNSPSLRRRTENVESKLIGGMDPRRRSNLEVPRASYNATGTDASRKSEALAPCIALNVPRTNIVTPWEGDT
ncbi:regulator of G-protein signaling 6-like isoform X4 [Mya arenaria]|uniref:regulator of G-protein signaling 6-like isoform X4 n=1 Tax=Mya arenaria TaxID=6604 RepID=UPI0022DF0D87|nr:regulator of G-protein signaling 6-like isoform X4 [Mya arenaria]XP_052767993.1 regulator of G-protein signaling 6-like isoform X4 [Mya arenaria]